MKSYDYTRMDKWLIILIGTKVFNSITMFLCVIIVAALLGIIEELIVISWRKYRHG